MKRGGFYSLTNLAVFKPFSGALTYRAVKLSSFALAPRKSKKMEKQVAIRGYFGANIKIYKKSFGN